MPIHSAPQYLRSDNGPERIAAALQKRLAERGAKTLYITPGSPGRIPILKASATNLATSA